MLRVIFWRKYDLRVGSQGVQANDEKGTDRFYQAIERRCPQTLIGKESVAIHWFVDTRGPWSKELLPTK